MTVFSRRLIGICKWESIQHVERFKRKGPRFCKIKFVLKVSQTSKAQDNQVLVGDMQNVYDFPPVDQF